MLNADDLAELEGWADSLRARAHHHDDVPRVAALCQALTGHPPRWTRLGTEAALVRSTVFLRRGTPAARARWLVCHELAELAHLESGYSGSDIEARCDALGAMLVVPRSAFRHAVRSTGHRVHELARIFRTTQSLALLRVGEVTGRPVALVRPHGTIARGEPWVWPSSLDRSIAHPLRITDEPNRVGMMVRREAWFLASG